MKRAPNVKELPKDKLTEAIIFAGTEAYSHAQHWIESEGKRAGDDVPPVYIGEKQLAELASLIIIDEGRESARVYRAGDITQTQLTTIATKLALAGVRQARLFDGLYQPFPIEDWSARLPHLKREAENGESLVKVAAAGVNLSQMADNKKALLLAARYNGIAIHAESEAVHAYRAGVWEKATQLELSREMVAIYNENQTDFSKRHINNVIEALKIVIPVMEEPRRNLIAFTNGVYDMETGLFSEHCADNWITNHNGIEYSPAVPGENLHDHAPNFHKWLSYSSGKDALKMQRICAGLFMVLANRYDWQLFLEITGEGGSGKSVFTQIATLLAGEHNTASGNMVALDTARGRAQFVGKSMITLPDQPKYTGEGTGIKAITGGDAVEIDPKNEHQFTAVLRAVVIATNNTPMIFTERAGGVARRRVIFQFNHKVREADKDPELPRKIAAEIPVIIRRLLDTFADPDDARALLIEQRDSEEALEVKRASNPVLDLCAALAFMSEPRGLEMGGGKRSEEDRNPRQYLYHLYLSFMEYQGLAKPLSVTEFGKAVKEAAKEYKAEYLTRTIKGRRQTNVQLTDRTEEFL
ncbi:primase-like DNA-binding domain-containing protein [Enterobacter hormaechei subsp. hoffmannii]|nr:primase-like DNA-binding domain-containing protein [Enterobacter hormaechei subsp. hoffmannii]